ncbi:MAG: hypothetical protein RL324_1440 [Verrucomicrobiota bacterium]|jgi:hypothetical protein
MSLDPSSPEPAPRNRWLPWFVAIIALLGMGFFALRTAATRQEAESLRLQLELRDLELRDARNRGAAERLILERQIEAGRSPAAAPKN